MNSKIDAFIEKSDNWQSEMKLLRSYLLDCNLTEELKWKQPCYTFNNTNLAIIAKFKEYVAISFLKGVLLKDTENILISPGENSQSVRYLKFTNTDDIIKNEAIIKAYIFEAIEVEKTGLKIEKKDNTNLEFCEELLQRFKNDSKFEESFKKLTPGRQRAYNMFFEAAKQSKTRETRINKYENRILDGFGINDCVCGLSKRKPNCDGSHKQLDSK